MSAIFGIWQRDGAPVEQRQVQNMQRTLAAWGPDGEGCWQQGSLALGQMMLWNTPEARYEVLPCCSPGYPQRVLCADARIDNRSELLTALQIPAAQAATLGDSQLILHAYERWGEACPRYLVGDYAFALWDGGQQRLVCGRDALGLRPFYYHASPHRLIFASDIKAILAVGDVPQELDPDAVLATHYFGARELQTRTLFRQIAKLPAAHTLTFTAEGQQQQRYWHPPTQPAAQPPSLPEAAEQLRQQVEQAVAACLRTPYPVGSHLSGGLDSSSITLLAAQQLAVQGRQLAGLFSWSPPPPPGDAPPTDERARIEVVCRHLNLACDYTALTQEDVIAVCRRDLRVEPTTMLYHESLVQQTAAARNIRVLLSGWGGDEAVTHNGQGYLAQLLLAGEWRTLTAALQQFSTRQAVSRWSAWKSQVMTPLLPDWLQAWQDRRRPVARQAALTPSVRRLLLRNLRRTRPRAGVLRNQRTALLDGYLTQRCEAWCASGAPQQIDYRYPLLDRRLLDFCLGLPPSYFLQQGWKRYLFRRALSDVLPAAICWAATKHDPAVKQSLTQIVQPGQHNFVQQRSATTTVDQTTISCVPNVVI